MQDLKNIFSPKKYEKEIEAERLLNMTAEKARVCLGQSDFKIFRESYERTEKATVDAMISFSKKFVEGQGDLSRYALVMMRLTTKIESLRYLLKTVETNAKRGQSNENAKHED